MKPHDSIRSSTRVWRIRELEFNSVGDDTLALDAQAGFVYSLVGSGARIWELLSTPQTVDAICAQLRQEYDVDGQTCLDEVTSLVAKFVANGLVATDDGSGP